METNFASEPGLVKFLLPESSYPMTAPTDRFASTRILAALMLGFLLLVPGVDLRATPQASAEDEASKRRVEFSYGGIIKELPNDAKVRVWLPVAQTDDHQTVNKVVTELNSMTAFQESVESKFGNKMMYFEFQHDGESLTTSLPFKVVYDIRRHEVNALKRTGEEAEALAGKESVKPQYLQANQMVPITGAAQQLISGMEFAQDPIEAARQLYDRVEGHMTYDKSKPGYGNGDVLWACDSQTGNCTDFHSLFISFARSRRIPAFFEIGFPLPPERGEGKIGGYHCWANFFASEKGWVPVDISEADKHPEMKEYYFGNLTENRVAFSHGRDIDLVPQQAGPALNYFVYPYVEVDGKVWPKENIELQFRFTDIADQE